MARLRTVKMQLVFLAKLPGAPKGRGPRHYTKHLQGVSGSDFSSRPS